MLRLVDWLFISRDKYTQSCVQKVRKFRFLHMHKTTTTGYELVLHALYYRLITSLFGILTSYNGALYTLSTQPIKTIYLNKGDNI